MVDPLSIISGESPTPSHMRQLRRDVQAEKVGQKVYARPGLVRSLLPFTWPLEPGKFDKAGEPFAGIASADPIPLNTFLSLLLHTPHNQSTEATTLIKQTQLSSSHNFLSTTQHSSYIHHNTVTLLLFLLFLDISDRLRERFLSWSAYRSLKRNQTFSVQCFTLLRLFVVLPLNFRLTTWKFLNSSGNFSQ